MFGLIIIKKKSVAYSSKMVSTLSDSIDARLSQFESDECYILASLLDSSFKIRWCETEKVDKYVDLLRNKVKQLSSTSTPSRKRNPSGFISEVDDYIS
jgi:hypothetical protein